MQAIIHERFGNPTEVLSLSEVEQPAVTDGQVLVRVHAAAVAKGDWLVATGTPLVARPMYGVRTPKHSVAGLELAGVVEAVGAGVTRFAPGDEVFGWAQGTLAEFAAVPEDQLAAKPAQIPFEQAAAIPVSGFAALQAVRDRGKIATGDRVLVIGASGGVGSFAVQIAKALGAEVTGVASTRNLDMVRDLGADDVIDYTTEEITASGRRWDVVIDIAGNRSLRELRRVLAPRGTLVIVGSTGGRVLMGFGRTVRAALVSPFVSQRLRGLISTPDLADLETLAGLVRDGSVSPAVEAAYPLADAPIAIELVGAGRSRGKTVVSI